MVSGTKPQHNRDEVALIVLCDNTDGNTLSLDATTAYPTRVEQEGPRAHWEHDSNQTWVE
jgi:hypothetical protein